MAHDVVDSDLVPRLATNSFKRVSKCVEANPLSVNTKFIQQLSRFLCDWTILSFLCPRFTKLRWEYEICVPLISRCWAGANGCTQYVDQFRPQRTAVCDTSCRPQKTNPAAIKIESRRW